MIKIALQNNGKLNAGGLLPGIGKGPVQSLSLGGEDVSPVGDIQSSFSVIIAKMVNNASRTKAAASSADAQNASSAENKAFGSGVTDEQNTSLFMLKIKGFSPGQENEEKLSSIVEGNLISLVPSPEDGISASGAEVIALELNLPALLQAIEDVKPTGEKAADASGSEEAVAALSSCLAMMISARQNQGGVIEAVQADGITAGGQDGIPGLMQGVAEMTMSLIDKLSSLENIPPPDLTEKGNKIILTLPQELLKGIVINPNGQPHFATDGFVETETSSAMPAEGDALEAGRAVPADGSRLTPKTTDSPRIPVLSVNGAVSASLTQQKMGENDSTKGTDSMMLNVALPSDEAEPTLQLVRLNTTASSASPQAALLAAALGSQKTNQQAPAVPDADSTDAEGDGAIPVNPFQQETLVKSPGERQVREMFFSQDAKSPGVKVATQSGTDPRQALFSQNLELDEQTPTSARKIADALKEGTLLHEDATKGTLAVSGKENVHWVPYAGATSPQVPPGAEAPVKGVFIPMDRLISEAGAALEKGAGKVQMTLQPPSLGTINMEVVVQNNRVELVLTANHADVQQILQANSDQLKNALNNQGFQVDQMSVLLRRENFGFNLGGNPLWQNNGGQQPSQGNGSFASPSSPEPEIVIPRDYGPGTISIFA